jgi:D-serine deaminase-like pyridoxal phosphate-dependent protein
VLLLALKSPASTVFTWDQIRAALAGQSLPLGLVDLDAFDANVDTLLRVTAPRSTLRVATKSLRVPALIRRVVERGGARVRGLMPFHAREAALLVEQGFDDLLMGYPVATRADADVLAGLASRGVSVVATVDNPEQVRELAAAARAVDTTLSLCIDVDMSMQLPGGVHIGVRRSPLREPADVVLLANLIRSTTGVELSAMLAYEAQVAGLPDHNPNNQPSLDPVRRVLKKRSIVVAAERRAACLAALREAGHQVRLVNGGGTGSLESTSIDPSVTEVTAGSGFLAPLLFDHYDGLSLQPALFFVMGVCRVPGPNLVTCSGGGYIASGASGADRSPQVYLPKGLRPLSMEGWGEVQTPFESRSAAIFHVGDPVVARPAKGGELAERFGEYVLLSGGRVVDRVQTYRGYGGAFG